MPFSYSPGQNDIQHVDLEGSIALIDAAKAAGVKHYIYTSFSGNLEIDIPLCNAKRAVEKHLKASGLTYTILRPSCFMEVWLSPAVGFDAANAKATIYGSGDQPVSWIAIKDVVAFAVESLTNPAARNAVLEMGGPEMVSPHQAVKLFEQAAGRPFEQAHVPVEALRAQMEGATDPMQKSFAGLMVCITAGDPIEMKATLQAFPLKLTSVQDYARSVMGKA
jgi:NADH dehydrogenase